MKRALPVLVVFLIGLVAFATAFGLNTALRLAIAIPSDVVLETPSGEAPSPSNDVPPPSEGSGPSAPVAMGLSRKQYVDAILKRNIFDAAAIGRESATSEAAPTVAALSVRLIATMVAEPEIYSSALIAEEGRDGSAKGYGIGDKLQDAEVIAIESRKVTLKRADGNLEYLSMDDKPPPMAGAPAAAAPAAGAEGGVEGITQLGENHYQVERRVLEQYLGNLEGLSSMARAIPHKGPDGEVDGYRLSGIRRNSPLSQLGIKNGDVIHGVNGTNIGDMSQAMTVFNSLSSQSHFSFDVTRRGQKQTMEYDVK